MSETSVPVPAKPRQGIQSIEVGMRLLRALAANGRSMMLRDVAFNPVEAVEDVATLLSAKAGEKDIELVVRGSGHMPAAVMGDAGRFRQIVTNLVGNAVKFTDRGHVLIDLASEPAEGGGVEISIRVEDTGAGIPEDKMASIFEKFSQVDASSTRRHEGTGLGLAITDGVSAVARLWFQFGSKRQHLAQQGVIRITGLHPAGEAPWYQKGKLTTSFRVGEGGVQAKGGEQVSRLGEGRPQFRLPILGPRRCW